MSSTEAATTSGVVPSRAVSWIAGQPSANRSGETREILDPARGTVISEVPDAEGKDVDEALRAARAAFEAGLWSRASRSHRGDALLAIALRIREHIDDLALIDSLNVGKPIGQARDDAGQAADFFDNCGRVISTLTDEILDGGEGETCLVVREPVGVVAAITPWNFPVAIAASALAPALAAGNSVVLKPSPQTPLSALRIAEIASDLLPHGTLSVVAGGQTVGRALADHAQVDRIVFTGSTATGREIMRVAAQDFKRVGLELGGKSPTIVFADAPFDAAVRSALARFTLNQGENCSAGTRLLVQESIADRFIEALVAAADGLSVGDPQQETTAIGPMITARHLERVRGHMEQADAEAARLYVGPTPSRPPLRDGFFAPVSIWRAGPDTALWRNEVFGPTLAVTTFEDEDDAIRLANDSDYGLMAVVWCGDRARGIRVARRVQAGIVRINQAGMPTGGPWGGFKASGIGRSYGRYGIDAASELKQINIDLT